MVAAEMDFRTELFDPLNRCVLGIDAQSGAHLFAIPVSNRLVDYEEFYKITAHQFELFTASESDRERFAQACRQRLNDDLLWYQPGTDRGVPY